MGGAFASFEGTEAQDEVGQFVTLQDPYNAQKVPRDGRTVARPIPEFVQPGSRRRGLAFANCATR
jgi:hypothetical protein